MFDIDSDYTFSFNPIVMRDPDGKELGSIGVEFRQIDVDKFTAFMADNDFEGFFKAAVIAFSGLQRKGKDMPHAAACKAAANKPVVCAAVMAAYNEGNANSFRGKSGQLKKRR